jgi:hypothetical protein
LPPSQRALWTELSAIPPEFTLYGGTAIALRFGHRQSVDFDFFAHEPFDPDRLLERIPFLADASVVQREANTLTCHVTRGRPVAVSFFGVPRLGQVSQADMIEGTSLRIASTLDLAGTKVSVVQRRSEMKDYVDIDMLIRAGIDLPTALAAGAAIYGPVFNPQITLKALCYFGDDELGQLSEDVRRRLVVAVAAVDLDRLPGLTPLRSPAVPRR